MKIRRQSQVFEGKLLTETGPIKVVMGQNKHDFS